AIEVSKAKNTRPEDEYTWISNGIDLGWLGEYQGWGRAIKGLPKSENFATKVPKEVNANGRLPVVSEITDYKTAKIDFSSLKLEMSKQNKHLENTNEYNIALSNGERKSIITTNLDSLKGYAGSGQKIGKNDVGSPGSKERVNFDKIIGNYIDPITGESIPTSMGIIHYSKKGYHIVPARPKLEEK
ncbi:polymorphic toxin type 50 domain-containing protein, partial [Avibacterium paragallinarum]